MDAKHGLGLVLWLRLVSLWVSVGQESCQVGKSEAIQLRVAEKLKFLQRLCTLSHLAGDFDRLSLVPFLVSRSLHLLLCLGICMLGC